MILSYFSSKKTNPCIGFTAQFIEKILTIHHFEV